MGNRWLVAVAAIVAVVAVGGIGFATFTATAYLNGSGSAGTVQLEWGAYPGTTPSQSYVTCTATVGTYYTTGDTLTVTASNLAPGDSCAYSDSLNDAGTLPGGVYSQVTTATATCGSWFAYDNWGGHVDGESPLGPIAISPSTPIAYGLSFGLYSGNPGCAGATISFTEVFTISAGT